MSADAATILAHLRAVAAERDARAADAALGRRVLVLKTYQHARFTRSHAAMLAHARYGPAAGFFLEDLYGPRDFADRDAQFARIVPAITRMFPHEVVQTVVALAELHALSEQLDSQMATHLPDATWGRADYLQAWQAVGRIDARLHQLDLVLDLGRQLDHFTRKRLLRQTLRVMRGPARAAGLAALQDFLERGFDTFAAMNGAEPFLEEVRILERATIERFFAPDAVAVATGTTLEFGDPIGQLP
jgi:hypothetical protein